MKTAEEKKQYLAEYYKKNKDRIREINRSWLEKNKEAVKRQQAEYRTKNREAIYKKQREWVEANREKDSALKKKHYEKNKDKWYARTKSWLENNPDKAVEIRKKSYRKNRGKILKKGSVYQSKNRGQTREKVAYYRIKKWTGVPPWVNRKEIREFYHKCPAGFVVDHMIPIRNPIVCGLHVLWNLQYLPKRENDGKGNRLLEKHMVCGV